MSCARLPTGVALQPGELIYKEGEAGQEMYVIQAGQVRLPAGAHALVEEGGEAGVGLEEPAAGGDSVGFVADLVSDPAVLFAPSAYPACRFVADFVAAAFAVRESS